MLSLIKRSILLLGGCAFTVALARPLDFDTTRYTMAQVATKAGPLKVRVYANLPYVSNPADAAVQVINVYIPDVYFQGKSLGMYNAQSAPIFFPNRVGGYMPAAPATLSSQGRQDTGMRDSTVQTALAHGYVVASPGVRGRTSVNAQGVMIGKAPAAIVDLKAAIRYLHWNDQKMPGNAERIFSNGTSAGGALSALLGATGNHGDYVAALDSLGAAPGRDDIFAVSAYCPITNLDHADMAYEWQFVNVWERFGMDFSMENGRMIRKPLHDTLSAAQKEVSQKLAAAFPAYVNSLALRDNSGKMLQLDGQGQGSFKEYVQSFVVVSAQAAQSKGVDMKQYPWLRFDASGIVNGIDFSAYVQSMHRQKLPPAFDAINLSTGENQLFGNVAVDKRHFTDFSQKIDPAPAKMAEVMQIKMMNPMYYIGAPGTQTAKFWRIRHGTQDKDTGLAISVLMATLLRNRGYTVDFALPWDKPHSGDYDLAELFAWIDGLVQSPGL